MYFIEEEAVLAQFLTYISIAKPTLALIKPDSYWKLGLQIVQQMQYKLWEVTLYEHNTSSMHLLDLKA